MFYLFFLSYSTVYYEISDCQTTITYFGTGIIYKADGEMAKGKKKIIICEGITEISPSSFSQTSFQSSALNSFIYEELELPRSLVTIGNHAFTNYYSYLRKIHFPDYTYGPISSTSESQLESFYALRNIGQYAFSQNYKIVCHNIPPTFSILNPSAFDSCSIKHIKLNSKTTTIGSYAFRNCIKLQSIVIPCYVKTIESGAFYNCIKLKQIKFERITEVTVFDSIFYNCSSLQQVIFPENVIFQDSTNIFYNCLSLTSVELPNLIRGTNPSLPKSMFYYLPKLVYCTFPTNLKSIPESMFEGSSIEKVYLPETIEVINKYAFRNCTNLKYIEIKQKENSQIMILHEAFYETPNCEIMVVHGRLNNNYFNNYLYPSSLTGSVFCLLDPYFKSYRSYRDDAFFKNPIIYASQEYVDRYNYFDDRKMNHIINGVCDLPEQTPYPIVPDDKYDVYPFKSDCSGYVDIPPCSCNDCGKGCPADEYIPDGGNNKVSPTASSSLTVSSFSTISFTQSNYNTGGGNRDPVEGNNPGSGNNGHNDNNNSGGGLSGGAIAGICVGIVGGIVLILGLINCFCCRMTCCCCCCHCFYKVRAKNCSSD